MEYIVKEILGSKMFLLPQDEGLSRHLTEHGEREVASTEYTKKILKPDWICIDIGANLGYYALLEARLAGFVYAVEPLKLCYQTLNKSIGANGYKNIKTYNLAMGSKNETSKLRVSKKCNWSTMADYNKFCRNEKEVHKKYHHSNESVRVQTLDYFVEHEKVARVDFVRMDVEGYEIEIIKGALNTLEAMPHGSYLAIEIHGQNFSDKKPMVKMFDSIMERGFTVEKVTRKKDVAAINSQVLRKWLLGKNFYAQVFFRKA